MKLRALPLVVLFALPIAVTTEAQPKRRLASKECVECHVLTDGTGATEWIMAPGERTLLIGVSPLPAGGALQLSFDLTATMAATSSRVKRQFAAAGAAWAALLALMFWAGGRVIGRPLKRIQNSVRAENQDLEALANGVHERIWALIEHQRKREVD